MSTADTVEMGDEASGETSSHPVSSASSSGVKDGGTNAKNGESSGGGNKFAEFEPPQAVVNRIMKSVLPDNVQITKDARNAFTRASGVFIFYLTHCANDISKEKRRSTIYGSDVS